MLNRHQHCDHMQRISKVMDCSFYILYTHCTVLWDWIFLNFQLCTVLNKLIGRYSTSAFQTRVLPLTRANSFPQILTWGICFMTHTQTPCSSWKSVRLWSAWFVLICLGQDKQMTKITRNHLVRLIQLRQFLYLYLFSCKAAQTCIYHIIERTRQNRLMSTSN